MTPGASTQGLRSAAVLLAIPAPRSRFSLCSDRRGTAPKRMRTFPLLCRSAFCFGALVASAACLSSRQARAGEPADGLVETEIRAGNTVVVVVEYKGRSYRRIAASDLRGLTLGSVKLPGRDVCVEGKFDRLVAPNTFRLMGSDRDFVFAGGAVILGLMQGDNGGVGGGAEKKRGEPSCLLRVREVVRLKGDFDLFDERARKYEQAADWRKLLELGSWIEENGKLVAGSRFEDIDRYHALKGRASRMALRIRERTISRGDADALCEVARSYTDLLGRMGRLKAAELLRRDKADAPRHQNTCAMLRELGYVRSGESGGTREDLDAFEREKARAEAEARAESGTSTEAGDVPPEAVSLRDRVLRTLEIERKARSGSDGLIEILESIPDEDEFGARRIVGILANTRGTAAIEGVLDGRRSRSDAVRKDIADALAWRGRIEDLSHTIRSEKVDEVRVHAVAALARLGTRESVDALVRLTTLEAGRARARTEQELRRLTGQSLSGPEAWGAWWQQSGAEFVGPAEKP